MDKILITGTGRSGTTFLMLLFTFLGLDTGFDRIPIFERCNSGMELEATTRHLFVKSPDFLFDIEEIAKDSCLNIVCVIVPVRRMSEVLTSRERYGHEAGGFIRKANTKEELYEKYTTAFAAFLETMVAYDLPTLFLDFAKLSSSCDYSFSKLQPLFEMLECRTLLSKKIDKTFFEACYKLASQHQQRTLTTNVNDEWDLLKERFSKP